MPPFLIASTTCTNTGTTTAPASYPYWSQGLLGGSLQFATGSTAVYRQQNCVTQYFVGTTSTSSLPVTFATGTTSTTTISSSSQFYVTPTFTGGDIVLILFAILWTFILLTSTVIKSLSGVKTKKTYIAYSNNDVPIDEQP
jgi:hypothetical protein